MPSELWNNKRTNEILTETHQQCKKGTRHPDLMIKNAFPEIKNIFLQFSCTCTHVRVFVYGSYVHEISLSKDSLDQRLAPTELHKTFRQRMNNNSLQNANITCKRCSDRKFEESIMASQFTAIYFQTRDCVSWILDDPAQPCRLISQIFNRSHKLQQFAISFTTLTT